MSVVCFDIKGVIVESWVPDGLTVNQHDYTKVIKTFDHRKKVKRPASCDRGSVLAHTVLLVKQLYVPETQYNTQPPSLFI